jgi:inhibitor of cysteine peptidase
MRKIVFFIVLVTVVFAAVAPFYFTESHYYSPQFYSSQLKKFSSYEDLKNFVKASSQAYLYYPERSPPGAMLMAGRHPSAEAYSVSDYSTTNIQVEGVDEADIVKTDGEYIYVVSNKSVVILKAYPAEEAEVLSKIDLDGALRGMFINGDKLVVFEDEGYKVYDPSAYETPRTFIKVYDISDKENPDLTRNDPFDGNYINSRMIGDYVYVVINQPAYRQEDEIMLPRIYSDDTVKEIPATEIYYLDVPDYSYAFTAIVAVNVQNDAQESTYEPFLLGATSIMYVSLNSIYITSPENERTLIYRIHIEENQIKFVANGEVPGYVLNQFSMDEHEGYFRIATTTGQVWNSEAPSKNHVYVLDMDLNIVGRLEDLAPGEKIYSARFMGDRCYLVTFRKIDPLFVIDLKNPYTPEVLGQLKITGYSDYLHPYDENHVIGIGKETVAAEQGDFSWYQGVKISLFDVSDVENPKEIDKYEIGDRGTDSPVLRDHKAFLFDKSRNLLVIPVSVAEIDETKYPNGVPPNTFGDFVWQGAYIFDISLDEGLVLKGRITHLEDDSDLMKNGYYFSSPFSVKRSLYIDNVLYTISEKKIKMNSLEDLEQINEIELL